MRRRRPQRTHHSVTPAPQRVPPPRPPPTPPASHLPAPAAAAPSPSHSSNFCDRASPILTPAYPLTNDTANLRAGPDVSYAVVGRVNAGDAVSVVGRSADGEWLQRADGVWIAAALVEGVAAGLPVVGPAPVVGVVPTADTRSVAVPVATAPPSQSQGQVSIIALDKRAEYADLRNDGAAPVDLSGWVLRSERGMQDCALAGVLQPGQTLRVWAMGGEGGFDCGFGSTIWNNSEADAAVLLGPDGREVGRFGG